jgi:hypothetical protein
VFDTNAWFDIMMRPEANPEDMPATKKMAVESDDANGSLISKPVPVPATAAQFSPVQAPEPVAASNMTAPVIAEDASKDSSGDLSLASPSSTQTAASEGVSDAPSAVPSTITSTNAHIGDVGDDMILNGGGNGNAPQGAVKQLAEEPDGQSNVVAEDVDDSTRDESSNSVSSGDHSGPKKADSEIAMEVDEPESEQQQAEVKPGDEAVANDEIS